MENIKLGLALMILPYIVSFCLGMLAELGFPAFPNTVAMTGLLFYLGLILLLYGSFQAVRNAIRK